MKCRPKAPRWSRSDKGWNGYAKEDKNAQAKRGAITFSGLHRLFGKDGDARDQNQAEKNPSPGPDDLPNVETNTAAIDSTNQNSWQAMAVLYYQKNDFDKMAKLMSHAVSIFPEDFRLNLFYGLALNDQGTSRCG